MIVKIINKGKFVFSSLILSSLKHHLDPQLVISQLCKLARTQRANFNMLSAHLQIDNWIG